MRIRTKRRSHAQAISKRITFLNQYRNLMRKHHAGLSACLRKTIREQHPIGDITQVLGAGIPWHGLKIADPRLVPEPLYTTPWDGRGNIPFVIKPVSDQDAAITETGLTYVQGTKDVTGVDVAKLFQGSGKKGTPARRFYPFGIIDSMRMTFGEGPDPVPDTPPNDLSEDSATMTVDIPRINPPMPISSVEVTLPDGGNWQVMPGFEKHLRKSWLDTISESIMSGSYERAYPTAAGDFYFYYGKRSGAVPFTKSKLKKLTHRQAKKGRANHRFYHAMGGTRSLGGRIKDHIVERLLKFPGLFSSHNKARFDSRELTITHTYQETQTNEDRMIRTYVKEMLDSFTTPTQSTDDFVELVEKHASTTDTRSSYSPNRDGWWHRKMSDLKAKNRLSNDVTPGSETPTIDTLNEKYELSDKLALAAQPFNIDVRGPYDSKPVEMRMSTSQARARLGDDELYGLYLKKLDSEVKTHLANPLFAAIETVFDEAHGKSVVYQEIILRAIRYISMSIPPRNIVTKADFSIAAEDHYKGEPMPDWEAGAHIFPEYHIAHDVSMDLLK